MKHYFPKFTNCFIIILLFCCACNNHDWAGKPGKKVYIGLKNGAYTLYRNGQPFLVKGGSGFTRLKELKQAGGNTIRTWDTTGIQRVLDSAQAYGLAVMVGLPMPLNEDMDLFYNHPEKVQVHHRRIMAVINRYKNHPALLCWCLGNEIAFPFRPYKKFYTAFNNLVDGIHHDDPDHPVTTTIMTFQKKNIFNIQQRTRIDFISFNIFGSIHTLKKDLANFKWMWKGPFLISEWGIEGPWVSRSQNAWGAYTEHTSTTKAGLIRYFYEHYMPVKNPRYLGSMIFYWGHKQELTPTWFSLFDARGNKTETVNIMQRQWGGPAPRHHAPYIKGIQFNGSSNSSNILLNTGDTARAQVSLYKNNTAALTYRWQIMKEDWFKKNGFFSEKKVKPIPGLLYENNSPAVTFKTPGTEGPYRLFVYIYNRHGYYATANIPFYVVTRP